jgi:hypothetical protein
LHSLRCDGSIPVFQAPTSSSGTLSDSLLIFFSLSPAFFWLDQAIHLKMWIHYFSIRVSSAFCLNIGPQIGIYNVVWWSTARQQLRNKLLYSSHCQVMAVQINMFPWQQLHCDREKVFSVQWVLRCYKQDKRVKKSQSISEELVGELVS